MLRSVFQKFLQQRCKECRRLEIKSPNLCFPEIWVFWSCEAALILNSVPVRDSSGRSLRLWLWLWLWLRSKSAWEWEWGGGNPFFPMVRVCIIGVPLFIKTRLVTQEKCHTLGNILTYWRRPFSWKTSIRWHLRPKCHFVYISMTQICKGASSHGSKS